MKKPDWSSPARVAAYKVNGQHNREQAGWDDERERQLSEHAGNGLSASQIAEKMKKTRAAVTGKCRRLNIQLLGGKGGVPVKPFREVRTRDFGYRPSGTVKPPTPLPQAESVTGPVALITELTRFRCHWPIGDPLESGFGYCGQATAGRTYCAHHAQVNSRPSDPRALEAITRWATR